MKGRFCVLGPKSSQVWGVGQVGRWGSLVWYIKSKSESGARPSTTTTVKGVGAKLLGLHELVGRDRGSENNAPPVSTKKSKDGRN